MRTPRLLTPTVDELHRRNWAVMINRIAGRGINPCFVAGRTLPHALNRRLTIRVQSRRRNRNLPPPVDENDEIKLDATLVNIPILVSDRSGRYIPQLTQNDFLLYEDGTQQEIAFFGDEEVPFNVALVLDVSPSVQGSLEEIQRAALEFVRQLRGGDRVMIVSFDKDIHYHTDFTSNRRELESAIRNTETGSGTSVYDAVYEVVSRKFRAIEGRKALILLSDGEDTTSSHASYDEAVNVVTESDVLVYGLRYDSGGGGNIRVDPWPRNRIPQHPDTAALALALPAQA